MLEEMKGEVIVLDMVSPFVFLGTLTEVDPHDLVLTNVDVHDLRDSRSTREVYVHEARVHGVAANRKRALVRLDQVVSVSRLADVHA